MASIYPKNDYLYLQWSELMPSGKRVRRQQALSLPDNELGRRKAEIIRVEKEIEMSKPKSVLSLHYPLSSAFKDYLAVHKRFTKRTKLRFIHSVESFIETNGELYCAEVSDIHVQNYLESMGHYAPNTKAAHFSLLHAFFNWLKLKRYISDNPFYRLKKTPRKIVPIPDDLFEQILELCSNNNQRNFLKFLWLSGFRKGEALSLKWSEIDFTNKTIYVRNTKADRRDAFPLYNELELLLREQQKITSVGKVFSYSEESTIEFWINIRKKLGHDFVIHDIRKTFATKLVNSGVSIYDAKELLRHRSVTTTEQYYAKVNRERLGEEAERVFRKPTILSVVQSSK